MNYVVYSGILAVAVSVGLSHGLSAQEQRMASAPMPVESVPQSKAPVRPATSAPAAPTVTVAVKDMPRLEALQSVVKSAGYDLMYSRSVISLPGRVDAKFSKTPLSKAVQQILNGTDVTAEISAPTKTVRLSLRDTTAGPAQAPSRGTLRGRVVDSTTKQPVNNVTITVPGTPARTLTQDNGTYSMTVPAGAHMVIARRIGYQEQQLRVTIPDGGSVSADFVLVGAPSVLSEVVTTGSGDRAKVEVGNSIATIDAEEVVENNAIVNFSDLLRGRAQGLDVIQSSGIVGSPSRIRIRGINSMNASNDPIIIMDGVRLATNYETGRDGNIHGANEAPSRIDDIDPNIIESVEVLKGPSAAALWGADAANGVIVIKTKRGRPGTTRWTLRGDRGWALPPDNYRVGTFGLGRVPNGQGILTCSLIDQSRGLCVHIDSTTGGFNRFANDRTTSLTTGLTTTIGADLSGGAENVQYFLSGTRNHQLGGSKLPEIDRPRLEEHIGGPLPSWMKRPLRQNRDNVMMRVTGQPTSRIDYSVTGNLIQLFQTAGPNGISNNSLISPMAPEDTLDLTPGWELVPKQREENVTRFSVAGSATARPFSMLTLSGTVGRDYAYRTDSEVLRRGWCWTCPSSDALGNAIEGKGVTEVRSVNFNGIFALPINSSWTSRTAFGGQYQRTTRSDTYRRGSDLPRGATSVNSATGSTTSFETSDDRATVGTYVDQSVAFRERLFLSVAVRRDLGSALGADVAPLFPKWSGSWVISDESFFPWRASGVTLRLRAAFGHAGVQPASLAKYRSYSQPQSYLDNGQLLPIMIISGPGNADLRPERSTEREGGFELGLWDERVVFDVTVFRKFTVDALVDRSLAPSVGISGSQWFNVGNVLNTGLEGTMTARLYDGENVSGNITLGYASRRNKLVTLGPNIEPYSEGSSYTATAAVVRAGYPLFGRWGIPILGASDLNGDGIIGPEEIKFGDSLTYIGPSEAKADLSIAPSIGLWRDRVTVSALFQYVHGLTQFNEEAVRSALNNPSFYNPATPLGTQACYVATRPPTSNYACFYETVNYLRWNNLSVSYHLPMQWASMVRANSASVALLGSNLGVWSNYSGMDPGLNSTGPAGNLVSGHTTVQLPPTWTLRMRLTF